MKRMPLRDHLPEFDAPPAIETYIGVYFSPVEWTIPDIGLFWAELRSEFPEIQVLPPLGEFQLLVDSSTPNAALKLPIRCWYLSDNKQRLIQVQHDRFFQNWRRTSNDSNYLHYHDLRPSFAQVWQQFMHFLKQQGKAEPKAFRTEVTYVNILPIGAGWSQLSEVWKIFPTLGRLAGSTVLPEPDNVSFRSVYTVQPDVRVTINSIPVLQADGVPAIQLTVSASGETSSELENILKITDVCHDYVITSFADITSKEMHEIWQKRR